MHAPVIDRRSVRRRSRATARTAIGPRTKIVHLLYEYPELPIDTVAVLASQSRDAVERYIEPLIHQGLIERRGDILRLTAKGTESDGIR